MNSNFQYRFLYVLTTALNREAAGIRRTADFTPEYRVTIDVQRFESTQGQAAMVEAVWTVRKTAGGQVRTGRSVARETVQGKGFDELAAAHSQAIAKMSGDIAAAIRNEAEQKS